MQDSGKIDQNLGNRVFFQNIVFITCNKHALRVHAKNGLISDIAYTSKFVKLLNSSSPTHPSPFLRLKKFYTSDIKTGMCTPLLKTQVYCISYCVTRTRKCYSIYASQVSDSLSLVDESKQIGHLASKDTFIEDFSKHF